MRYCVVIPAAGSGTRMGSAVPKVMLKPGASRGDSHHTILQLTVQTFAADERCERIVVCAPSEHVQEFSSHLSGEPRVTVVAGGVTRQRSVLKGVEALEGEGRLVQGCAVLVHDAARCCVSAEVIARVLEGVAEHGAVTAAIPAVDSLCRVEGSVIAGYVERATAWSVQTPQGFDGLELLRAHRAAEEQGVEGLDDAALVARLRPVSVVLGHRLNIKVTQPEDLLVAAAALESR